MLTSIQIWRSYVCLGHRQEPARAGSDAAVNTRRDVMVERWPSGHAVVQQPSTALTSHVVVRSLRVSTREAGPPGLSEAALLKETAHLIIYIVTSNITYVGRVSGSSTNATSKKQDFVR